MAFQMIHMEIAYRLSKRIPCIENVAEFILGSVAPDSVHMNPDFDIGLKIKSHSFEGCGEWSDTQDYQRWKNNINAFCYNHAKIDTEPAYRDFVYGLCVHCLTDYWNDIENWRRLQAKYIPPMDIDTFKEAYYPEARGIDLWLYQNSEHTSVIRQMLSEAKAYEVDGIIYQEDIEKQRKHLLNVQYQVEKVDISDYRFMSESVLYHFIEHAVSDIAQVMEMWLEK